MVENTPSTDAAESLLAEIAPLTGGERMRRSALHAVEHAGTDHLAATVAGLNALGHAGLGAHMALAARDTGLVIDYLNGDDQELRRSVLLRSRNVPLPDEALEALLEDATHRLRRTLYTALYRSGRETVADRILPRVRHHHGEREAALLLPACSTPAVEEHLDGLAHLVKGWGRFARRHPALLRSRLERERDSTREWIWANPWFEAAEALAEQAPELVVPFLHHDRAPGVAHPNFERAYRLLRAPGDREHYPDRYPAHTNGRRDLRGLLAHMREGLPRTLGVLRAMDRRHRLPILDRLAGAGRFALLPYLGLLPADRRGDEARRILDSVERSSRPGAVPLHTDLEARAHLPFHEAEPELTSATGDPDVERRERALYWLVRAAGEHGAATLTRVLSARLDRSAADRASVRRSVPLALGVLHPSRIEADAVPGLHRLLDDTLAAPDTDAQGRWALRHLALHLLHHPAARGRIDLADWSLTALTRLVERFGADGLGFHGRFGRDGYEPWHRQPFLRQSRTLAEALTPERARELYARLTPVLARHRARGEHMSTVALARELGGLLQEVPDLVLHDLRDVVVANPLAAAAEQAAGLHLRGDRRGVRARSLFREDPRCVLIPEVWEHLAVARPALVPEALAAVTRLQASDGRLARRVVRLRRGLTRSWLTAEHAGAVDHLRDAAARASHDPSITAATTESLSILPGAVDLLLPRLDEDDRWSRELALVRLARVDEPERALRVLLNRVGRDTDSRAVTAALDSCARRVRPSALMSLLGEVLTGPGKVTVRKAAARALSRTRPSGAVELLAGLLDDEGLHRDVHATVVGELIANGDHPAVLPALEAHRPRLTDPEAQAALLHARPTDLSPRLRSRAARLMFSLPPTGRFHVDESGHLRRLTARWALWDDELAERLIADLSDPDLPDAIATGGLGGLVHNRRYRARVPEILVDLVDRCSGPDDGVPERGPRDEDRASLPRRVTFVTKILVLHVRNRADFGAPAPNLDRTADRLAAHPGFVTEALALRHADLPQVNNRRHVHLFPDTALERVISWATLAARLPGAEKADPASTARHLVPLGNRNLVDLPAVTDLVRRLVTVAEQETGSTGRTVGLLGLALATQEGERREWAAGPWAGFVADLGRVPHEAVRTAAWRAAVL